MVFLLRATLWSKSWLSTIRATMLTGKNMTFLILLSIRWLNWFVTLSLIHEEHILARLIDYFTRLELRNAAWEFFHWLFIIVLMMMCSLKYILRMKNMRFTSIYRVLSLIWYCTWHIKVWYLWLKTATSFVNFFCNIEEMVVLRARLLIHGLFNPLINHLTTWVIFVDIVISKSLLLTVIHFKIFSMIRRHFFCQLNPLILLMARNHNTCWHLNRPNQLWLRM